MVKKNTCHETHCVVKLFYRYKYDKWRGNTIPVFEQDQEFVPTNMQMVRGNTTAPPLLTEADLIAMMVCVCVCVCLCACVSECLYVVCVCARM